MQTTVRFGSKADICNAKRHVRFTPESGHVQGNDRCLLWANSGHSVLMALTFTGAGRPHQWLHYIARKPCVWQLSGIREYCLDPKRRLGKDAPRLDRTRAQPCSLMQRILRKGFRGSFVNIEARFLVSLAHQMGRPLARRCTVSLVLCRKLARPPCFALEQS